MRFAEGDRVLDAGSHIGAFSALASRRGARVVGYEAARENWLLARSNTAPCPSSEQRWGALWRSDGPAGWIPFDPPLYAANTGAGQVLFVEPPSAAFREEGTGPRRTALPLAGQVPAVPLDDVLRELERVRLLKLDVEGAEFPILLTSSELGRVEQIVGEIHPLAPEGMTRLRDEARVGSAVYSVDLLRNLLEAAGFRVEVWGHGRDGLSLFDARR
jgi:FkbM family methyltransferase